MDSDHLPPIHDQRSQTAAGESPSSTCNPIDIDGEDAPSDAVPLLVKHEQVEARSLSSRSDHPLFSDDNPADDQTPLDNEDQVAFEEKENFEGPGFGAYGGRKSRRNRSEGCREHVGTCLACHFRAR